jgi:hypothetical protein
VRRPEITTRPGLDENGHASMIRETVSERRRTGAATEWAPAEQMPG